MDYPIDIVYLWVDPTDKKWAAEKDKWMQRIQGKRWGDAITDARFRDNGELLHSLRSVAENAPWVNHIYIITGVGQVPKWLNTKHPKITIVAHEQIMPADAIPTFNSDAIEMCIPNIPNLAEHFILMNDDMFFNKPVGPEYFFDRRGRAIVRHGSAHTNPRNIADNESLYKHNLVHSGELIEKICGRKLYNMRPSHGIDPYIKSSWRECASHPIIAPDLDRTIHNKFRTDRQVQRWIFNLYDYVTGRAVLTHARGRKNTRHKILDRIYNAIHFISVRKSAVYCSDITVGYNAVIRAPQFCINDTDEATDTVRDTNVRFLESRWPNKCEFEN